MKVYVKKEDRRSILSVYIFTIIFIGFPLAITFSAFQFDSLLEAFSELGVVIIFATIFLFVGLFMLYSIIKPPIKYYATLTTKTIESYKRKNITYMIFSTTEERNGRTITLDFPCFTYKENNLTVNNKYLIYVKEINFKILKVKELSTNSQNNIITNNNKKLTEIPFAPILITMFLFGFDSLAILGIKYYPEYAYTYILVLLFTLPAWYMFIKGYIKKIF